MKSRAGKPTAFYLKNVTSYRIAVAVGEQEGTQAARAAAVFRVPKQSVLLRLYKPHIILSNRIITTGS